MKKVIGLASDHGGYYLKEFVAGYLESMNLEIKDYGCNSTASVDYPDYSHALANAITSGEVDLAFAFCGSANGISIALNRHKGVRAAICWQKELATLAREHNDANVCSMPGRFLSEEVAVQIVDAFLESEFEGGRHSARVEKIEL